MSTAASPRTGHLTAHLALAAAQVAFGLFPVVAQLVFREGGMSPLAVGAWRITGGTVILLGLTLAVHGRAAVPARADLARFVVAALLGVAVNQGLFLVGLARSTPVNATLVMCLIPVFTFTLAVLAGREHFSTPRLAGVLVALGGMLPLLFEDGLTLGRYGVGNLLMVANALAYSTYLILAKPLLRRYPPLVMIAWAYAFSAPLIPVFAWGERLAPVAGGSVAWWGLAYTVLFPTVLAYLFNMFALSRVGASTTAIYIYAQPLVTALASWGMFGERPTPAMLVAAAALFVGVWLVSHRPRREQAVVAAVEDLPPTP